MRTERTQSRGGKKRGGGGKGRDKRSDRKGWEGEHRIHHQPPLLETRRSYTTKVPRKASQFCGGVNSLLRKKELGVSDLFKGKISRALFCVKGF